MKQTFKGKNNTMLNNIPMIMKLEGKYQSYENGIPKENVSMKADYDGDDLEVNIKDKMKKKETYLQLSNDQLFELMSHNHTEQSLMKQLENEVKIKPIKYNNNKSENNKSENKKSENKKSKNNKSKNEKKDKKEKKKTQRKKVIKGRKGKKGKQTRRRKK